jgi:hypothetical protein
VGRAVGCGELLTEARRTAVVIYSRRLDGRHGDSLMVEHPGGCGDLLTEGQGPDVVIYSRWVGLSGVVIYSRRPDGRCGDLLTARPVLTDSCGAWHLRRLSAGSRVGKGRL